MKKSQKPKAKHADEKQDKALFGKMIKKYSKKELKNAARHMKEHGG